MFLLGDPTISSFQNLKVWWSWLACVRHHSFDARLQQTIH